MSTKKNILKHSVFFLSNNEKINLNIREKNNKFVSTIENISNVDEVKKFTGKLIYLEKKSLPSLKKNQYYFSDLDQMNVYIDKKRIGKVEKVLNHGAGDYLEITFNNKEILVPFNFDHILKVDVSKNELHLNTDYYDI
tara:strand:- start:349 stop:762 length:414 start_codon:yes stop_codon:yes gene_type:complete